jgi:hypothetical protein
LPIPAVRATPDRAIPGEEPARRLLLDLTGPEAAAGRDQLTMISFLRRDRSRSIWT